MLSAGFEPATPAIKRLQTYALDRIATGTGFWAPYKYKFVVPTYVYSLINGAHGVQTHKM